MACKGVRCDPSSVCRFVLNVVKVGCRIVREFQQEFGKAPTLQCDAFGILILL